MDTRYSRNRLYLFDEEQKLIKNTRIFLGGAGIGSIIAECALRFGFENITIVDGDAVELSNLNRQNYEEQDLGEFKAKSLAKRLLRINPNAKIDHHCCFIDENNVKSLIAGHDIAVNALDFKSDIPFLFDTICQKMDIPVLHPFNFGWAGFLTVVKPDSPQIRLLSETPQGFELKIAEYVIKYSTYWLSSKNWLEDIIDKYKQEEQMLPPPQLSIGSWIAAGLCVNVMYNIMTGKEIKVFPKFYLTSVMNDDN